MHSVPFRLLLVLLLPAVLRDFPRFLWKIEFIQPTPDKSALFLQRPETFPSRRIRLLLHPLDFTEEFSPAFLKPVVGLKPRIVR